MLVTMMTSCDANKENCVMLACWSSLFACVCLMTRCNLCVCWRACPVLPWACCVFTKARRLRVTRARRWARLTTIRRTRPHRVRGPCSHAHVGCSTTACVSSPKRLCSLHWLTCSRTWTCVCPFHVNVHLPLQTPFTTRKGSNKMVIDSSLGQKARH